MSEEVSFWEHYKYGLGNKGAAALKKVGNHCIKRSEIKEVMINVRTSS